MAYRTRKSKAASSSYHVVSGKTHRVVARTKKLTTARKRAAGLVRRGSKRVSIMRGGKSFPLTAVRRRRRRATAGRRRTTAGRRRRATGRRTSRRRSSRPKANRRRRRSRRNSRRRSSRRSSRRRSSRRKR